MMMLKIGILVKLLTGATKFHLLSLELKSFKKIFQLNTHLLEHISFGHILPIII